MTKPLVPDFKKWTTDDKRLLVVLLLTLIYPVFLASFFALYLFVLMPLWVPPNISLIDVHHEGWYHLYWLITTMIWVILCTLILPFFDKKSVQNTMCLASVESPPHDTKIHSEPMVTVEVKEKEDSQSSLSRKSENSTDKIKNSGSDLDVEKEESFKKSDESLSKSVTALDRKNLTQSGEFLNDCISSLKSEEPIKSETVCEVHAEEENKDHGKIVTDSDQESLDKERSHQSVELNPKPLEVETNHEKSSEQEDSTGGPSDNKKACSEKGSDTSSEDSSSDEDPEPSVVAQEAKHPQTSSPMKINEATVEQHESTENLEVTGEVDVLDNDAPPTRRKKATPTIDTSRASGYYECSLPAPKSATLSAGSQNNTVFLYVNPDTAPTEDSILVSHGGEVKEADL